MKIIFFGTLFVESLLFLFNYTKYLLSGIILPGHIAVGISIHSLNAILAKSMLDFIKRVKTIFTSTIFRITKKKECHNHLISDEQW